LGYSVKEKWILHTQAKNKFPLPNSPPDNNAVGRLEELNNFVEIEELLNKRDKSQGMDGRNEH
jgi:hypothetical protein